MKKKIPKDIKKDVDALLIFLKDVQKDADDLRKMLLKYKRRLGTSPEKVLDQVMMFDDVLQRYEWFQDDADVNGERIKKIALYLKHWAKKKKIETEWINNIDKAEHWNFDW